MLDARLGRTGHTDGREIRTDGRYGRTDRGTYRRINSRVLREVAPFWDRCPNEEEVRPSDGETCFQASKSFRSINKNFVKICLQQRLYVVSFKTEIASLFNVIA